MKLRNKKTGVIVDLVQGYIKDSYYGQKIEIKPVAISNKEGYIYDSLAELNSEWEDYEEPKEYWHIFGTNITKTQDGLDEVYDKRNKEIGNYFESKEEAEKAVEKLKAWKRLKDNGFRFIDHIDRDSGQGMTRYEWDGYVHGEDLDLLFSQEDD